MTVSIPHRLLRLFDSRFDWIQVEVTTHCNAACIYCPRTVYGKSWQNRHFSIDVFRRLAPAFRRARHVHLQGWGEPFLNPHFFEMIATAKTAGCMVGTTTNAMLLDRERISLLLESGIDLVAVSLAGTAQENDRIRKGTNFARVLNAIRLLSEEKNRRKLQTPLIHIAFMLFKSGLNGLRELLPLVKDLGVKTVVISTLDFVASDELLHEVLRPENQQEYDRWRSLLEEVALRGQEQGIGIHYHLPRPEDRSVNCTENVHRALCISADSTVTPCVYTNLELPDCSYFAGGEKRPYRRLAYGNAAMQPLSEIWRRKEYREFRASFRKGNLSPHCQGCPKLC
jgi:MoaA/NifB/PqqE/SkfB family radical SAM enzyme